MKIKKLTTRFGSKSIKPILHHYNTIPLIHKYFHWFYFYKHKHALFNWGFGLFIWLFLAITQPFGIYDHNLSDLILLVYILPISLLWVLISYAVDFTSVRLLRASIDQNFRLDIWAWVFKLVLMIHLTFFLRGYFCSWLCVDFMEYLQQWLAISLMFVFFYLPYSFYAKYQFFHNMVAEGRTEDFDLVLTGNTKEVCKIKAGDLAYIKADDNYVDLFLLDEKNQMRKAPLRATLKSLEGQLKEHSEFVRIHRSYIINSTFYASFTKEGNGVILKFGSQVIELPISKKYKPTITSLFTHPK